VDANVPWWLAATSMDATTFAADTKFHHSQFPSMPFRATLPVTLAASALRRDVKFAEQEREILEGDRVFQGTAPQALWPPFIN
jgi:hypothetical protein